MVKSAGFSPRVSNHEPEQGALSPFETALMRLLRVRVMFLRARALPAAGPYATLFAKHGYRVRMIMCRNIKTLYNFEPPATEEEIYLSSVQFVRKLSGFTRPSKANEAAFDRAVNQVSKAARELIDSLVTNAPPRDREVEAIKARARSAERFRSDVSQRT
jgi:hypothetical protein